MKKTYWIIIGIILGIIFYIIGFSMIHNEFWNPLSQTYDSIPDSAKTKLWGEFLFQVSSLLLTILILKFLLGMEPFKDAIKDIFKEIFSEYHFLKDYDKISLLKIAKNITVANHDIEFIDKTEDKESVKKLKDYYYNNTKAREKNYIVTESKYTTTLYAHGFEIMHRKIKYKIMEEGRFEFNYWFTAPDDNSKLDCDNYKNTSHNDRFNEISYNRILQSSITDDGIDIHDQLTNFVTDKGEKAIQIIFSKIHTKVGEIIDIEFSISHPFKLSNEKEIEDYYNSTYSYPHAFRQIVFQIERYNPKNTLPHFAPILYSDEVEIIPGTYNESIYYRTYSWSIFYSQQECETVSIKVE